MIVFLLPFATAALLYCSYHPVNLYILAWVALVPLIVGAVRARSGWRAFLSVSLAGYLFFFLGLQWTGYVVPVAPWLLPIYLGLYFGFAALIVRSGWRRGIPPMLLTPLVWTAFEYLRAHLVTGFPWFFLGHTQYDILPLIQICDITGVFGITFLVAMANGLFAQELLRRWEQGPRVRHGGMLMIGLLGVTILYGFVRMETLDIRPGPDIAVIQANVPQDVKKRHSDREIFDLQMTQTERALVAEKRPDLVVWAETMFPYPVVHDRRTDAFLGDRRLLRTIPQRFGAPFLFGVPLVEPPASWSGDERELAEVDFWRSARKFNSAVLTTETGAFAGRYDKIHLVPFGEYIPLRATLPFLDDFLKGYSELPDLPNLTPGDRFTIFRLGPSAFGALICYESVFPDIVRPLRNDGAEFIVNISNDGWFKESAELDQILVITQFRAVENRVGVVRATNTGISAFIGPDGRIDDLLVDTEGRMKSIAGVLRGNVRVCDAGTIYSVVGDLFALTATVILLIILLMPVVRRLRRRPESPTTP